MTPRQFSKLLRRHKAKEERLDYRAAQITSAVYFGPARKKDKTVFVPADFMPTRKTARPKAQTVSEMLTMAKVWNKALGGSFDPGPEGGDEGDNHTA